MLHPAILRRAAFASLLPFLAVLPACAGVVLTGGSLSLIEEGGSIAALNLAAGKTAFAKDVLPGYAAHTIAHANDQAFGNNFSWIGNSPNSFVGINLGATPVTVASIAFGRDNTGGFADRALGLYTLQYTTDPNPGAGTLDASWTTIGTLDYQSSGGPNFAFPPLRHRFNFLPVSATGIRLIAPGDGVLTGAGIDELELYSEISVVTTTADELDTPAGANLSLREAVRDAAPGGKILFAAALSGQTITLTTGAEIVLGKSVTIDASALTAGIIIDGGAGTNRIFSVGVSQTVSLIGLKLTGGNGIGAAGSFSGGAVFNQGALSLTQCTLSGNSAVNQGGAVHNNFGQLTLARCTLSGNSAAYGGAIYTNTAPVTGPITSSSTLTHCTLAGNNASSFGGGIFNDGGRTTLTHCTVSSNTASGFSAIGGGVASLGTSSTETRVQGSIIAGNTNDNVYFLTPPNPVNSFTSLGGNLIGSGNAAGAFNQPGDVINDTPLLAPLGNYGGLTQTMPPLPGSPALDGAAGSTATTDQRGFPVFGTPDIGAAEGATVVTTTADELDVATTSGAGISLREAVRDAPAGGIINFAPALSGQTAVLGGEIVLTKNVTLDASSLPAGLTLDGGGVTRLLNIPSSRTVTLMGLSLQDGQAGGGNGGAIINSGALTITRCTFNGNSATNGGAIFNGGSLSVTQSTIASNSASGPGGGICCQNSNITVTHCTITANSTSVIGGAVAFFGSSASVSNSILVGNTSPNAYVTNTAGFTSLGGNLIGSGDANSVFNHPGDVINDAPLLATLGNHGGPTRTIPLRLGSPARDAAVGSTITTDQRGFPIVGTPDIGAYEAGTMATFAIWSAETAGTALVFAADAEADGAGNGLEYALRRDPLASDTLLAPTLNASGGGFAFHFRYRAAATDLRYIVQRNPDLNNPAGWAELYRWDKSLGQASGVLTGTAISGGIQQFPDTPNQSITLTDPATGPRQFWRLVIEKAQ